MKDSLEQMRSEMEKNVANMDCEMKEVKEKLGTLTVLAEKIKDDEGQLLERLTRNTKILQLENCRVYIGL